MRSIINAMKSFSPKYAGNRMLGSEFFVKLNGLNFGKSESYPLVLASLIKAQFSGDKTIDGICKTICAPYGSRRPCGCAVAHMMIACCSTLVALQRHESGGLGDRRRTRRRSG